MAISTNQKPTIYRNLYENTAPGLHHLTLWERGSTLEFDVYRRQTHILKSKVDPRIQRKVKYF